MREWIVSTVGGGATALAIVVAIIGLAGALGGALTSYIVAQKTVYINAITAERMKWIGLLRANIASLIANLTNIQIALLDRSKISDEKLADTLKSMNELAKTIELQLNPRSEIDRNLIVLIDMLYKSTNSRIGNKIPAITQSIICHSQWLLKAEWERVKFEARGPLGKTISIVKSLKRKRAYKHFLLTEKGVIPSITEKGQVEPPR